MKHKTVTWSYSHIKKHLIHYSMLLFLSVVSGIIVLPMALLTKSLLDAAVSGNSHQLYEYLVLYALSFTIAWILNYAVSILRSTLGERYYNELQISLLKSALMMEQKYLDQMQGGEWLTYIETDAMAIAKGWVVLIPEFVKLFTRAVTTLFVLQSLNADIVILCFALLVVLLPLFKIVKKRIVPFYTKLSSIDGRNRTFIEDVFHNLSTVKILSQYDSILNHAEKVQEERSMLSIRRQRIGHLASVGFGFATNVIYAVILLWGGSRIAKGTLTYGELLATIQISQNLQGPLYSFSASMNQLFPMIASSQRIMSFEQRVIPQEKSVNFNHEHFKYLDVDIKSFKYHESQILKNVAFRVEKGMTLGIFGKTGIGKTTLLRIILGLYSPTHGSVVVSDTFDNSYSTTDIQGLFSYVSQDYLMIHGTLEENVSLFDKDIDTDRMDAALRLSLVDEFSKDTEHLEKYLSGKTKVLSGGQAQRLAIARALYSKAPVIILDEPINALDKNTQKELIRNIQKLDKTIIIVSHDQSVVEMCDHVIHLGEGGVVL